SIDCTTKRDSGVFNGWDERAGSVRHGVNWGDFGHVTFSSLRLDCEPFLHYAEGEWNYMQRSAEEVENYY
ncbi:MAG: hypothetical protein WAN35_16305, partial [Terracidiphilus sp.]